MKTLLTFSELLRAYFTDYLMRERNFSPHTIANYRDTFRLIIAFAQRHLNRPPTRLAIHDLDATFVVRFLDHLENERGVRPQSRNVRLAAIHSFFNYVALQEPAESRTERESFGENSAVQRASASLPSARPTVGLPPEPLIMPSTK